MGMLLLECRQAGYGCALSGVLFAGVGSIQRNRNPLNQPLSDPLKDPLKPTLQGTLQGTLFKKNSP